MRKAKSLVKLLTLSPGHRLHREQVMDVLWPGLKPRSAANNLHQILHAARRAFEPSALSSGSASSGYLLLREEQLSLCPESPLWVDAEAFQEEAATARHAMEPHAFRAAARAAATTRQTAQKAHPREQEIALLVGRGLINRQIAQKLSISERTVENHISKILKKLGFSSRARIATWVAHR